MRHFSFTCYLFKREVIDIEITEYIDRTAFIQEYLNDYGFSLIPLKSNTKEACMKWKPNQDKKASFDEVVGYDTKYLNCNLGIITGRISSLAVIDVDQIELIPRLFKLLPEAQKTTRVKTRRGYHFYFSDNGNEIRTTDNFLGLGIELKYNGCYVVACPSIIDNFKYSFEIPLSKMLPFPKIVLNGSEGYLIKKALEYKQVRDINIKYRGQGVACISQIKNRALTVGERTVSLFILYNLLLQNKNEESYSKDFVIRKNLSLTKQLSKKEVENIFKKVYNYSCSSIIEKLPYINCDNCSFKFKGGKLKMSNILIRNQRKIANLNGSEVKVLALLGSYFQGESPSQSEIIRVSGLSKNSVREAIKGLKKKGIE